MVQALKTRLEERAKPTTTVIKSELLAGRVCPLCNRKMSDRAPVFVQLVSEEQWATTHAGYHYLAGETLERDA